MSQKLKDTLAYLTAISLFLIGISDLPERISSLIL